MILGTIDVLFCVTLPTALYKNKKVYQALQEPTDTRFARLGNPHRVWAVAAVHAESSPLMAVHDLLYQRFCPGDRIVYLGNYFGFGPEPIETIDEILTFRRAVLARPGVTAEDFVYLRGGQEEMWQKLMQIQFAQDPAAALSWLLDHGMAAPLEAYGINPLEGLAATRKGMLPLTRWTARIREAVRSHAGHDIFAAHWRRAAHTDEQGQTPLLFVHAGLNPSRALQDQGDAFWWEARHFEKIKTPYRGFHKIIRGFDPDHRGLRIDPVTATIDGGCGFGGKLVCAGFEGNGSLFDLLES